MLALYSIIAVVFASLCGWMLSGSPVPLAFSAVLITLAIAGKQIVGKYVWGPIAIAVFIPVVFGLFEWHLFRTGQAMISRAETPSTLHLAMSLLWASTMLWILSSKTDSRMPMTMGIAGGIFLAASAAGTVLYDFSAWQIFPIAALPFTIFFKSLCYSSGPKRGSHVATFSLILLITTFVISGSTRGTTFLYSKFGNNFDSDEEEIPQRPSDTGSGSGAMDGASRKIPREGNVTFNHQIRLYVKPHSLALLRHWEKGPLYFRTATLTRFESDEVIAPLRSGLWLYDADDGVEDSTVNFLIRPSGKTYAYSVFLNQKDSLSLPLSTETESIAASAVYEFADNWFQLSPPKEVPLFRFTARAGIGRPIGRLNLATRSEKNLPYLSLPPSPLSARVRELTRSFDSGKPLSEIQNHLNKEAEYSLSFSTPENMSPIENFVFGDHKGHCEHYGSATVLMLRAMGVPSRLAYGYTGGSVDRKKSLFAFRDSDFHTWSEVLTKDRGWVIFDTVPGTKDAAPRYPAVAKVPAIETEKYHNVSDVEIAAYANRPWIENGLNELLAFLSLNFIPVLLTILGLIAIMFWRLRKNKTARDPSDAWNRTRNVAFEYPEYLVELGEFGAGKGVPHTRSMTWREFESRLARRIETIPEVSRGITYYYAVRFAGCERDPDLEALLERRFRDWRKAWEVS